MTKVVNPAPQESQIDLFEGAFLTAYNVHYSTAIDDHKKDAMYSRIEDALDALLKNVPYEVREDGSWFFESKPKMSRVAEEKKGHLLTQLPNRDWVCDCLAGSNGTLCWARAARSIVMAINSPAFTKRKKSDDLFVEDEEPIHVEDQR